MLFCSNFGGHTGILPITIYCIVQPGEGYFKTMKQAYEGCLYFRQYYSSGMNFDNVERITFCGPVDPLPSLLEAFAPHCGWWLAGSGGTGCPVPPAQCAGTQWSASGAWRMICCKPSWQRLPSACHVALRAKCTHCSVVSCSFNKTRCIQIV